MSYRIQSTVEKDDETGEPLCWHNDDGWVSRDNADVYSKEEKETTDYLPADSVWLPITNMEVWGHIGRCFSIE